MTHAGRLLVAAALLAAIAAAGVAGWRWLASNDPRNATGDDGIVMISADWCGYCRSQRALFDAAGVSYRIIDADSRDGQLAMFVLGARGVPVTVVGQQVVRGYDIDRLRTLLAPLGHDLP